MPKGSKSKIRKSAPTIILRRRYEAEAAHRLTAGVPAEHPCRRLHGHRYRIVVEISGPIRRNGMLVEYGYLDAAVRTAISMLDHEDLNTLARRCSSEEAKAVAANPTVERLAVWLATRIRTPIIIAGAALVAVEIEEDSRSVVRFTD